MKKKTRSVLIGLAAAVLLLSGCAVTQTIDLAAGLDGTAGTVLQTSPLFKALIVDLTGFDEKVRNSGQDPDTIILDDTIYAIWAKLLASPACDVSYFERTDPPDKTYYGSVVFNDLAAMVEDLASPVPKEEARSLVDVSPGSLTIRIGMDNYGVLAEMVPFLKEENFEAYGPLYNNGSTEEDYLEMMDFILGEGTGDGILASSVKLYFTAPAAIVSTNGEKVSENSVVFAIPLIKLLLLNEDIVLSCSWLTD